MKPINVGLLGIGTVGGGTWTVHEQGGDAPLHIPHFS